MGEGARDSAFYREAGHTEGFFYYEELEDTARYAGLLLAPAEGFGFFGKF